MAPAARRGVPASKGGGSSGRSRAGSGRKQPWRGRDPRLARGSVQEGKSGFPAEVPRTCPPGSPREEPAVVPPAGRGSLRPRRCVFHEGRDWARSRRAAGETGGQAFPGGSGSPGAGPCLSSACCLSRAVQKGAASLPGGRGAVQTKVLGVAVASLRFSVAVRTRFCLLAKAKDPA